MAEGGDDAEKTEEPTQKRLDDAREKGQVASSREVHHWFMILGGTIITMMFLPSMMHDLGLAFVRFIEQPHLIATEGGGLRTAMAELLGAVAAALIVPAALLVALAIAAGLVQHGFLLSFESIQPKLQKISIFAGFKRLFALMAIIEFGKGILKLAIVGTVATVLLLPALDRIELTVGMDMAETLALLQTLAVRLLVGVLAVMALIAATDLLYQKFEHTKRLRMSRQDLKEEFKQTEGDPMIKQRLRQIRLERSRRRMMAAIPEADVVITNPTHFAVALKYDPDKMQAPTLVAKGADSLAQRIREVALEHRVPLVENPPLARALHAAVDLDQEVPAEHYKAVAEVISFVWKLNKR